MANNITEKDIEIINEKFKGEEIDKLFAVGVLTHPKYISSSRLQMVSTHITQTVMLNNPDTPRLFTGYEKIVGSYADSFYKADQDYVIVRKIPRFSNFPNFIYLLVVKHTATNQYDVIKVSHYEKKSDNHGYMRPFTYMDDKKAGSTIKKDEYVQRANSMDENENYRYGVNAKVAYISSPENEEDAIICSESFAKKTTFNLVTKTEYTINKNDIMLNLYGDANEYKFMPNVGENVNETGILFASRKIDKKNISSDLTDTALSTFYYDDNKFLGRGKVIDIDIKVNNAEELQSDSHRDQLSQIYNDQYRYNREIYDCLTAITRDPRNSVSYMLEQELFNATNYINPNIEYSSTSKFEFAYITVYTSYETTLHRAYKLTNRCGGKGVIGSIWPDEYMPVDQYGTRAELIISTPSIVARANISQSYEQAFNYCSDCIVRMMKKLKTTDEQIKLLFEYLSMCNPEYAAYIKGNVRIMNKTQKKEFIDGIFKDGIYLYSAPFHGTLGLKELAAIKAKFKIKPSYVRMRREYKVPKDIADLYQEENYVKSIQDLNDNYIWTTDSKKHETLGLEEIEKTKNVKNQLKLPLDVYVKNTWVDDYVYGKEKFGPETKSENNSLYELSKNIQSLSEHFDTEDRTTKEFNSFDTKIFKKDDNTLVREFRSKRPIVIADVYYVILKHIPDNNFSARYLGNTTPLGLPNKAFNKAENGRPFSNTCNKMGEMETSNLRRRCTPEIVARYTATVSTHPELRSLLARNLLFEDPLKLHDLDVTNDEINNTIPALMFKAYLGALGGTILDDDEKDPYEFLDNVDYKTVQDLFDK